MPQLFKKTFRGIALRVPTRAAFRIGLLAVVFALAPTAFARNGPYRIDHWTADSGLPQNSVLSILQTRDGYLWFTTLDGLVRYDGVRFKVFDKGNTKGIGSNRFNRLFEDQAGNLWAGTEEGGLTLYRGGQFRTYTTTDGLPGNWVLNIQNDLDGFVLIVTDRGAIRWKDGRFAAYEPPSGTGYNRYIYVSPSGARWFSDQSGLHRFKDGHTETYTIPDPDSLPIGYSLEDQQGSLWLPCQAGKLVKVMDGKVTVYGAREGLPGTFIQTIYSDQHGNLWVGTVDGLCRFKEGGATTLTTLDGLSSNNIRAVCEDREGSLWVGTSDRGLNRLSRQAITVYSARDGLVDDNVYPILEDRAGRVWMGSPWLTKFEKGGFTRLTRRDGLPTELVQSLYEDREGNLWVGGMGGVGYLKADKFHNFTAALDHRFDNLWAIHEDRQGGFWFATDAGIVKVKDGRRTIYTTADSGFGNDVKVIHEDRGGRMWFGTYGGLALLENDKLTYLTAKDGLGSDKVRAIYEDGDGVLWIGTYDGGISRLKAGRITSYSTAQGLYNNGAFQILEDANGYFWISCNRGIYRVSKRELNDYAEGKIVAVTCQAYGKEDGMINIECNGGRQPAGIKAHDGRLLFPTQQGVAVIDPETVPVNANPPVVVIEACLLDRANVDFSDVVAIAPGRQDLEISYTGLSFIKSELVRFKYRLQGLDPDWIDAGTRRTAYYSRIPPGSYRFVVCAANSDGVWNLEGAGINVRVYPPFWSTWWFTALAVMSVAGLALLVYRVRVSRLEKARALQEAFSRQLISSQEAERKRIAAELHDSLGQRLLVIKNWVTLSLMNLPEHLETREKLNEISENASLALKETRQIVFDLRPYQLDKIGLTSTLNYTVEQIADSSGIELSARIAELDGAFSPADEIVFYRIVQECLNNVVKHSGATQGRVLITRDSAIRLEVTDNGRGFSLDNLDQKKQGFGLSGIAERARMLGGDFRIESEPGSGTTISIRIVRTAQPTGNHE